MGGKANRHKATWVKKQRVTGASRWKGKKTEGKGGGRNIGRKEGWEEGEEGRSKRLRKKV